MAANGWNVGKHELARWLEAELALRNPRTTTTTAAETAVPSDLRVVVAAARVS
jgi:hypothetical protein